MSWAHEGFESSEAAAGLIQEQERPKRFCGRFLNWKGLDWD